MTSKIWPIRLSGAGNSGSANSILTNCASYCCCAAKKPKSVMAPMISAMICRMRPYEKETVRKRA